MCTERTFDVWFLIWFLMGASHKRMQILIYLHAEKLVEQIGRRESKREMERERACACTKCMFA